MALACSTRASLAAENLFLRKHLAFYVERKAKPRRLNDTARIALVVLARLIDWRQLLVVVRPETLVRWHRQRFRLFWRWQSRRPASSTDSSRTAGPDCRHDAREPDTLLAPERRRTPRVAEGLLFSARRARLAGQLHPGRFDRAPEDVGRPWLIRRLERTEQAVPDRGADAEVYDLSMVMEVMESLKTSQVGDAREFVAAMVLPVVHEGEIVVAGIQPEDQKSGDPGRKHEPEQPPRLPAPRS